MPSLKDQTVLIIGRGSGIGTVDDIANGGEPLT